MSEQLPGDPELPPGCTYRDIDPKRGYVCGACGDPMLACEWDDCDSLCEECREKEEEAEEDAEGRHSPSGDDFGKPHMRWKIMDLAFGDNLICPRRLIVDVHPEYYPRLCYTTLCERGGGCGSNGEFSLRTLPEWLEWVERFRDEKTGREMREVIEAAKAPFIEPQEWVEIRKRFAETGNAFID